MALTHFLILIMDNSNNTLDYNLKNRVPLVKIIHILNDQIIPEIPGQIHNHDNNGQIPN